MILDGTVTSGKNWHHRNMQPWSVLPFDPFPGTLNIVVGESTVGHFRGSQCEVTEERGVTHLWRLGRLSGLLVAVTWNSGCAEGTLEVLAASRLRDLGLEDGDRVRVTL